MVSLRSIGMPIDLSSHTRTTISVIGRGMRTIVMMSVGICAIDHKGKSVIAPVYRTIEVVDGQILIVLIG